MRISDWSSDVWSSDLRTCERAAHNRLRCDPELRGWSARSPRSRGRHCASCSMSSCPMDRSEEHTSELQSLMRNSYDVFWLKKKKARKIHKTVTLQSTHIAHISYIHR